MRVGPKYKICKRLGSSVFEKCQTQKFVLAEERHNKGRRRSGGRGLSDYGKQLLEKQRVRYTYGISEKQLVRYVRTATEQNATDPAQSLIVQLESRLDNAVYRMGLAATRALARQMVSHGHITVNGRKVTIPSYSLKEGETIAVREGSRDKKLFSELTEKLKDHAGVSWIQFDPQTKEGNVTGHPAGDTRELGFDVRTVLEYYSR